MNYTTTDNRFGLGRGVFYDLSQSTDGREKFKEALSSTFWSEQEWVQPRHINEASQQVYLLALVGQLFKEDQFEAANAYLIGKVTNDREVAEEDICKKLNDCFQKILDGRFLSNVQKFQKRLSGVAVSDDDTVGEKSPPSDDDIETDEAILTPPDTPPPIDGFQGLAVAPLNLGRPLNRGLPFAQPDEVGRLRPSPAQEDIPRYVEEEGAALKCDPEPEVKSKRTFLSRIFSSIGQWFSRLIEWFKKLFS